MMLTLFSCPVFMACNLKLHLRESILWINVTKRDVIEMISINILPIVWFTWGRKKQLVSKGKILHSYGDESPKLHTATVSSFISTGKQVLHLAGMLTHAHGQRGQGHTICHVSYPGVPWCVRCGFSSRCVCKKIQECGPPSYVQMTVRVTSTSPVSQSLYIP